MADKDLERVLEQVRRLLALAEDPAAAENEAMLAFERAKRLMDRYAVNEWMLHEDTRGCEPVVERTVRFERREPVNRFRVGLAEIVARANRCRTYWSGYRARNNVTVPVSVTFYGVETDVRLCEALWTSMELRRASGWRRALNEYARQSGWRPSPASWRNGYYLSFQRRIGERFDAIGDGGEATHEAGRELVLARDRQLDAFEATLTLDDRPVRFRAVTVSNAARDYGRRDADMTPLGLRETGRDASRPVLEGGV
ncbi:DUF2786 domain-containing protein [Bifidobacterium tsurumiense]|uniref:Uncharacterized protein n=1 Tax=Bifidobacterium tsurumiense TaxID=356829 RepID=A0A087EBF1_9BIFI|nr:DUF2786 domain-containing protein [Bifidobacterium tsurumiense]KFJ05102.1 hypothetical protein BITS_1634 [Bifidobacterium tsurumiense]